jgi:polyhydroxyalkanoate synthase
MATTETGPDAVAQFERMTEVAGKAQQMMLEFWTGQNGALAAAAPDADAISRMMPAWEDWARAWAAADPAKLAKVGIDYWKDAMKLWSGFLMPVDKSAADSAPPAAREVDRRFRGEALESAPVFDLVRKSYLLFSHYVGEGLGVFEALPEPERRRLAFQARQFVDAISPANFAALNPEVLAEARATDGESLLEGLRHLLDDMKRGKLTMTDEAVFEVGRNVAATPGRVV